jgi:hypothetical protein
MPAGPSSQEHHAFSRTLFTESRVTRATEASVVRAFERSLINRQSI